MFLTELYNPNQKKLNFKIHHLIYGKWGEIIITVTKTLFIHAVEHA